MKPSYDALRSDTSEAPMPAVEEHERASNDEQKLSALLDGFREDLETTLARISGLRRSLHACNTLATTLRAGLEAAENQLADQLEPEGNAIPQSRIQRARTEAIVY